VNFSNLSHSFTGKSRLSPPLFWNSRGSISSRGTSRHKWRHRRDRRHVLTRVLAPSEARETMWRSRPSGRSLSRSAFADARAPSWKDYAESSSEGSM
jgi:hypothetical protein